MRFRRAVAMGTAVMLLFAPAVPNLYAAERHSVTSAQLHQVVQSSHAKVAASRSAINDLLARAEVQRQFHRLGLAPDKVRAQVSMLGDAEIVRLHQQVMSAELQQGRAGLSSGAIVAIVVAGIAGFLILYWIAWHEINEDIYYY